MQTIHFQFPHIPRVHCLFSGRADPLSLEGNISWHVRDDSQTRVRNSREQLFRLGALNGLQGWCECQQVHGTDILAEPEAVPAIDTPFPLKSADGMMHDRPGIGLMIKTADCQPVLFTDSKGQFIMALHMGWRANLLDFPSHAIKNFCGRYHLSAPDLLAIRGPSLGPCHAEFINFEREWTPDFTPWFNSHTRCMDLWALTRAQLVKAGLKRDNIYELPICTYANHHAWFSHRRNNRTGRQAALIWINPGQGKGGL